MADICVPDVGAFDRLVGSKGSEVNILIPKSRHLMNQVDTMIELDELSTAEHVRYRIFYTKMDRNASGKSKRDVAEIPISSVVGTDQKTRIAFRPDLPAGVTTLLVIGCDPTAKRVSGGFPEQFSVINAKITGLCTGLLWLGLAALIIVIILALIVRANAGKVGGLMRGFLYCFANFRREVSLSLFQLFTFTLAVVLTVAYYYGRSGELTDLSEDVLLLLGISATGAVAGAWGDAMKNRLTWDNWRWLDRHGAFQNVDEKLNLSFSQLVTTRGEFDLYRFQALLFTLLVAPSFVIAAAYTLGEAKIPPGILAVLGLSQVTYLVGKLADTPTVADFNKSLIEQRKVLNDGDRLTVLGFGELQNQFEAAMGMSWAYEAEAEDLIAPTNFKTLKSVVDEAKENAKRASKEAPLKKTDPTAASAHAEEACTAAAEATSALRIYSAALHASEAATAVEQVMKAGRQASKALNDLEAMD